jgi:hypothetical protein
MRRHLIAGFFPGFGRSQSPSKSILTPRLPQVDILAKHAATAHCGMPAILPARHPPLEEMKFAKLSLTDAAQSPWRYCHSGPPDTSPEMSPEFDANSLSARSGQLAEIGTSP